MITEFITGAGYFIKGMKVLGVREIRKFAIFPFLINTSVYLLAMVIGAGSYEKLMNYLLPGGEGLLLETARVILWVLFIASVIVILFFTFNVMANLIGAPFNGLLSDKVKRYSSGEAYYSGYEGVSFISTILPSIKSEARKLARFLTLTVILIFFSLIPLINFIAPIIWPILTAWIIAVEYISYPMEQEGKYFSDVRSYIKARRPLSFGFGTAVLAAGIIPLLNFIVMPAAVAGATILYGEHRDNGSS